MAKKSKKGGMIGKIGGVIGQNPGSEDASDGNWAPVWNSPLNVNNNNDSNPPNNYPKASTLSPKNPTGFPGVEK